ncbi:MAG: hypothetical protein J6A01_12330 [Proteobacteria bacterium]|nr:hypothetical protein [Pseudomonadota bacterium]
MNKPFARCFVLSVILSVLATVGCGLSNETPQINRDHVYGQNDENTIMLCTDGLDNDGDTLKDCDDPGCRCTDSSDIDKCPATHPGATVCPGSTDEDTGIWQPKENTVFACGDGKDNDGNGYADCKDNNCKQTAACCVKTVDRESDDLCADGIDNDCNGYTDCTDNNCKKSPLCCTPSGAENDQASCSDGIDNDCNGYADCNDNNCKKTEACCKYTSAETSLEQCMDGIDNDCNGYMDCRDYSCSNSADRDVRLYCCTPKSESTYAACTDNLDNDCDGYADCNDASCYEIADPQELNQFELKCKNDGIILDHTLVDELKVLEYFAELKKGVPLAVVDYNEDTCSDKVDNDLNGLIDCADSNCANVAYCQDIEDEPAPRPAGFESLPTEQRRAIYAQEMQLCTDVDSDNLPIDNDKNGKANCDDYECSVLAARSQTSKDSAIEGFRFTCQPTQEDESQSPDQSGNE